MTERTVNLDIEGPEFFCPDCGRWLARAHDNGTFDLATQASVMLVAEIPVEMPEEDWTDAPTLMAEARCLRLSCRLRRWWRER